MNQFILTLNFRTPISAGRLPTLDAILAAEIAKERGDDAIGDLPLEQTEGVWHGSALFFDAPGIVRQTTKVALTRKERLDVPDHVAPSRGGVFRKWPNLMNSYDMQAVSVGVYLGDGDIDAVESIIRDVPAIGARRADGFGLIDSYAFDEVRIGPLWGLADAAGRPARPVPNEVWSRLGPEAQVPQAIEVCKYRPFYWSSRTPTAVCAVPASQELAAVALDRETAA